MTCTSAGFPPRWGAPTGQGVRTSLAPYIARPIEELADEEAYTVFCLHAPVLTGPGRRCAPRRGWSITGAPWQPCSPGSGADFPDRRVMSPPAAA